MVATCVRIRNKPTTRRVPVTISMDGQVLNALRAWMAQTGRNNVSTTIEDFVQCGIRDTCDGCPYAESEGQVKAGIGKVEEKKHKAPTAR